MKKRVLSIFLAIALCVSLAVPVFAAEDAEWETVTVSGERSSITITNVIKETTATGEQFENLKIEGATIYWVPASGATLTFATDDTDSDMPVAWEFYNIMIPRSDFSEEELTAMLEFGNIIDPNESASVQIPRMELTEKHLDGNVIFVYSFANDDSSVCIVFTNVEGTEEVVPPVAEVPSIWATEEVAAAVEAGIVPEALLSKYTTATTRAEFCSLAVALYEKISGAEIEDRAEFDDTDDVNVQKMAAVGVVNGYGEGEFRPDAKLTREQAATMLARLAAALDKAIEDQDITFDDADAISSYATVAVGQMQSAGIMNGKTSNLFDAKGDYSREQSIMTMMRLYNYLTA